MKDYKKIIDYILENSNESMAIVVLKFGYLFDDDAISKGKIYGIQLEDNVWKITHLNITKEKTSRYETNIKVESKLNK